MTGQLRKDLEAEAITLDSEVKRITQELKEANLPQDQYDAALRAMVEPRALAANALRNAKRALEAIPPMGIGRKS